MAKRVLSLMVAFLSATGFVERWSHSQRQQEKKLQKQ